MAFNHSDQQELFLPLVEGVHETPPLGAFMRNLVARTYARRAFLIITLANAMPTQEPTVIHVSAPRAVKEPPLDFRRLDALELHPYGQLRPGRVYGIDEMLDFDNPARLAMQRGALAEMGIRYGRWLRVTAGGAADAWLLLVREREDFSSSAVSTLAAIGPHLTAGLRTLAALTELRLQAAMAQAALGRLGAGQLAFDAGGRVMAADPQAEHLLAFAPAPDPRGGRRLQALPAAALALEKACAAIAEGRSESAVLLLDPARDLHLLLRKCDLTLPEPRAMPAVIGTLRLDLREDERAGTLVLRDVHGLSEREAALAEKLSRGESIIEAGRALRLTDETARNYSKRIYAKTGTRGQGDLVRAILSGLTPLA
ncbi:MAG: helix-turn-helix transcriptional regulator [Novosphingobium sp.]